jgi:uncharacterized protein YkwD
MVEWRPVSAGPLACSTAAISRPQFSSKEYQGNFKQFMNKIYIALTLILASLLTSCITISTPTETVGTPLFITSTLPPTKQIVGLPSRTPTNVPGTPGTPTLAVTVPADCEDKAVLVEDVTIPDNTSMDPGESFTKTWKLQNTGTCPWTGYTLVFADGDRMAAPESTPVPQTLKAETVDISVELVAPLADGAYTGNFSLHNMQDEVVPIGLEETMWVKILVGDGTPAPGSAPSGQSGSPSGISGSAANCDHTTSAGYVNQMLSLINGARADAGLSALTTNSQLTAAAQAHSVDMGCSNMTGHIGSNGSTMHSRIAAQGYSPSYAEEIVYAGGSPQAAFQWWMNDTIHRDAILNPQSSQVGIGYANVSSSTYGDYFTVDFASP